MTQLSIRRHLWDVSNSPYIVTENILVSEGVTLTINPGVTVKMDAGKSIQINGKLIAKGTSTNRITFTSSQSNPSPGDWDFIKFSDSSDDAVFDENNNYISGSIIQYANIEYAGSSGTTEFVGALLVKASHPYIENNIISNSKTYGIYATELGGTWSDPSLFYINNN